MYSDLSFGGGLKSSSSFGVGRGCPVSRPGSGAGWSDEREWHQKSVGCRRRLTNAWACLCLQSCGGAGVQGGRGYRSNFLSSWKLAPGAKACRKKTCWAAGDRLVAFLE
jgi:hypothetical protein